MVKVIIISFMAATLAACNYHVDKNAGGDLGAQGLPQNSADLSFAIVKTNILKPRCYECHSSTGRNIQPLLDEYSAVIANLRDIESDVATDRMPLRRTPLTPVEKDALAKWIAAGAPEFAGQPPVGKPEPVPTPPPVGEPKLDYASVHARVIEPMCLRCHTQPKPRAGVLLDSYENLKKNLAGVKEQVETFQMPPRDSLSSEQMSLLLNWIKAGAPEKEGDLPPPPPPPALDYATVRAQVIEPMCLRCHNPAKPRGNVLLDTYENTLKNIAEVRDQVEKGSMPPRSSLSAEQTKLLLNWIQAGAPQTASTPTSLRKCDEQNLTKAFVQFVTDQPGDKRDNCVQ